ncbi:tol-pal system protein YbgF [Denitromonas sp. IR12]|uniref:Cell division coordinator CpoB n=2 Tax=Denitromonas iodatirespirans TaxID=2795389 RepID=A0A944H817_DENI1|nr:tol-pal system protein YbgF [Denitromonas iodatirespirans]
MMRPAPWIALVAAMLTWPAHAGLFDDAEARKEIIRMRDEHAARLDTLEASSRANLQLANQIEAMKAEVAKLRGDVELMMHDIESVKKRQQDFYVDLDARLRKLETGGAGPSTQIDPAAESRDYESALNLLKGGKYPEAADAFDAFIAAYQGSSFLPSAHFWAGSAALQAKDTARATQHFNTVVNQWPQDARAPDALLGVANAQRAMGERRLEQKTLKAVIDQYPDSAAAKSAKQRLGS